MAAMEERTDDVCPICGNTITVLGWLSWRAPPPVYGGSVLVGQCLARMIRLSHDSKLQQWAAGTPITPEELEEGGL
jgi:hypothetical protein